MYEPRTDRGFFYAPWYTQALPVSGLSKNKY